MSQRTTPGDILLDAGTNELEVLVFQMDSGWFGVNVAKVREVIRWATPTESPNRHPSVLGMFNVRGTVLPLIDFKRHLGLTPITEDGRSVDERRIIITEFNGLQTGFVVDHVEQIHRMSWEAVNPAPDMQGLGAVSDISASVCTGVVQIDDRVILMIDFESVADSILHHEKLHIDAVENDFGVDRPSKRVVLAEDSGFMRDLMTRIFRDSGYTQIEVYSNGLEAWNAIKASGEPYDAVISDIEMPQMDGLHLTKQIKDHPELRSTPVVLFSSLITDDNRKKGRQVGADAQVPKPELAEMVRLVDRAVTGTLSDIRDEPSDGSSPDTQAA